MPVPLVVEAVVALAGLAALAALLAEQVFDLPLPDLLASLAAEPVDRDPAFVAVLHRPVLAPAWAELVAPVVPVASS